MQLISDVEPLLDSLRSELLENGELLNVFNRQQNAILSRDPVRILEASSEIKMQAIAVERCRQRRETLVKQLAVEHNKPSESALQELLPFFFEPVRPLLETLLAEIDHLASRIERRARENLILVP